MQSRIVNENEIQAQVGKTEIDEIPSVTSTEETNNLTNLIIRKKRGRPPSKQKILEKETQNVIEELEEEKSKIETLTTKVIEKKKN